MIFYVSLRKEGGQHKKMESREGSRKRKRKEEASGFPETENYLTLRVKNKKTGRKMLHMGAVQWLRYAHTHPEMIKLLWEPLGSMSAGEAFDRYHRAVEQGDSPSLQEIHLFFREHWDEARRIFETRIPTDIGPLPLIDFIFANNRYERLREELMVGRVSLSPSGSGRGWLTLEPRMRCEFPPEEPHDPVILDQVLHLVAPWLLSECVSEPRLRRYIYPALFVSRQFQSIFQTHIERMLYRKMLERYPAVETVWPDIWKEEEFSVSGTGNGYTRIISDMEIWPGHWRTIGRILEMKGLCRGNSAVSLVKSPIRVTYGRERPACGHDPRYTQVDTTSLPSIRGASKRWKYTLPVSKALNLFEAYIRLRWGICFECGIEKADPVRFFVQTDVHGGMVYICCHTCVESVFRQGPKPSCDSIPYAPMVMDLSPEGFLFPYARMIQMDLFPLYPTPISHNL